MTRRLSSSTRSHTEDSIFLRPDEDPVWLDEPAKIEKLGDGVSKNDQFSKCKDGPAGSQSPQGEEVFMHKVYALVVQIHCWAAVFVISQVTVREQTAFKKNKALPSCGQQDRFAEVWSQIDSPPCRDIGSSSCWKETDQSLPSTRPCRSLTSTWASSYPATPFLEWT